MSPPGASPCAHARSPLIFSQWSLRSGARPPFCPRTSRSDSLTPTSPLPSHPFGERCARGCAGLRLSQLHGRNTNLKVRRALCRTGRTAIFPILDLSFHSFFGAKGARGSSCGLLSFWGSFTRLHLARDAPVTDCHWVSGAAKVMPAGFQQLGGEVIFSSEVYCYINSLYFWWLLSSSKESRD